MSSIEALGNLDIWTDILQYFRIDWKVDSDAEVKENRKCLLRIALLSPSLTSPALDLLWRDMTSLVPVTQVINVNSESILQFSEDQGGYWTLAKPIASDNVRERTYEYLVRIHRLRITIGPSKEVGAGSVLSMTLGINPLLPSLKSLDLDFKQWNGVGGWAYAIGPLISPSLTSISYTGAKVALIESIRTLQCMFSSQALALNSIVYHGHLSPIFLATCVHFQNLEVLKLSNEPASASLQRATSGVSLATVFQELQNLVDLKIDLRLLPFPNPITGAVTPPPSLRKLSISGNWSDVGEFLAGHIKSPSLKSLTVKIFEPPTLAWKVVCDKIATYFPQLHSLAFCRAGSSQFTQMLPQDLSSLISRPTMRYFVLHAIPHCFTEENIGGFLSAWPDLQTLSIAYDSTIHFSASLLIPLSRARHLRVIQLPLDLTFLQDTLPDEVAPLAVSRINKLTITSLASVPPSLKGKIIIAKNLLTLFPSLEMIATHSTSSSHVTYVTELEELLRSFRSAILTYLQRKESERRLKTKKEAAFLSG